MLMKGPDEADEEDDYQLKENGLPIYILQS